MPLSKGITLAAALVLTGAAALADAPRRVVSLNVCTDQLALLLAAPEQLVSVSSLARDPRTSAYAELARDMPVNTGKAEEVVLLDPDLVLAGTFSTQASLSMLERLGYAVARFAPVSSLEDARANITRMGALLGREEAAADLLADFDTRLSALSDAEPPLPRTALYGPRGTSAGPGTLSGQLIARAGLRNIVTEDYGRTLPLEELILADPDLILVGAPYSGHSEATALLDHPALRDTGALRQLSDGANWVCETPALLDALAELRDLRRDWQASQ